MLCQDRDISHHTLIELQVRIAKEQQMVTDLKVQVAAKGALAAAEVESKRHERAAVLAAVAKYEADQKAKAVAARAAMQAERADRQHQVRFHSWQTASGRWSSW